MANPATTLARTTQDKRIPELDMLPPGTLTSTLTVPVYNPATDKTHQAPIGGPVPNTNAVPGGAKVVQYRDSRLYGVPAGALTLDRLDPLTIAPGTLATVDNPADTPLTVTKAPQQYVATVVAAGTAGAVGVPRYIGAAAGDTVPIIWVPVSSNALGQTNIDDVSAAKAQAVVAANVPSLEELDLTYDGKSFFDDRNPDAIVKYECRKSRGVAGPNGYPQSLRWFRTPSIATFDLLEFTTPQMDAIMALTYDVNGDALPADSPSWSKPGQWFDALDATAESWRYTCGRRRYLPGDPTSGVGPAWSRFLKLQQ